MFINDQYDFRPSRQYAAAFRGFVDACIRQHMWVTMCDVVRIFSGR